MGYAKTCSICQTFKVVPGDRYGRCQNKEAVEKVWKGNPVIAPFGECVYFQEIIEPEPTHQSESPAKT